MLGEISVSSEDEIKSKVEAARAAQKEWSQMGVAKRVGHMRQFRDLFEQRKETLARLTTTEMGMPISAARMTVDRALDYMDWALDHAETYLSPEVCYEDDQEINYIYKEPYGVAACISPWNFPPSNFVWACFQTLLAGNTAVFKNSEEVQLFAKELEDITEQSGLPNGVLNIIYGAAHEAEQLIQSDINLINFTGSSRVGQILYKQAAEKFIPVILEMGGSDPAIVFEDADLDKVIPALYAGRYSNCGQVCCALKRLIVHESLHDTVIEKLASFIAEKKVGDPMEEDTDIGPLAAERQLELLETQMHDALKKGAILHCGGKRPDNLSGAYYEPTILSNITEDMQVWHEEVFGPVLAVKPFKTYEEAIELANDTIYGLGAGVFTEDKELALKASLDIQSGMVKTNLTTYGRPGNPFGGYKLSGMGRENGTYGFEDAVQIKVIATEK